jgi:hypothetical protein
MKIAIPQAQLLAFVAFARAALLELAALGDRFVSDPVSELSKWCAMLGYELDISLDPSAHVGTPASSAEIDAALSDLGHTPSSSSSSTPAPAPATNLERVVLPRRRATPEEREGYERLLGGAKHVPGTPIRQAGPGSYFVMLDDGRTDVVLPRHALEFAGAEAPDSNAHADDVNPETVRAWEEMIAGRTGRIIGTAAADNFVVRFDDGQEITLPRRALLLAGCEPPPR